jgi:hypothetical protein
MTINGLRAPVPVDEREPSESVALLGMDMHDLAIVHAS